MLARAPVTRLSIATTRCPSAIRRSTMWLPRKPAPPVIRIRIFSPLYVRWLRGDGVNRAPMSSVAPFTPSPLHPFIPSSSDSPILEPGHLDGFRVEHVASVNKHLLIHHIADLIEVEVTELFPLGNDDDRV